MADFRDYKCIKCSAWYRMSMVPSRIRGDQYFTGTNRMACFHRYETKLIDGIPEFVVQTTRPKSKWRTYASRLGARLCDLATPRREAVAVCDVCGLPPYYHPKKMRPKLHITNTFSKPGNYLDNRFDPFTPQSDIARHET